MVGSKDLRREVWEVNLGIHRAGLVTMHAGNASAIDRGRGQVLIKPSGMDYDKLKPADIVVTGLDGKKLAGRWKPSVDLPHHLYLYRNRPDIGGVIHTHSNYATSFAMLGQSSPGHFTALADEFGAESPCVPYVDNQGDHIGEAILEVMQHSRVPAVLLEKHGVFTFGPTVKAAFKAAVMLEDVAKTCHLALLRGKARPLPRKEIQKW